VFIHTSASVRRPLVQGLFSQLSFLPVLRAHAHACDRTTLNTFVGWFVQNREGNTQSAEERRQGHGNIAHMDMATVHTQKGTTQDIIVITSMREAWKRDRSVLEKYKSLWQIIIYGFGF